MGSPHRHDDLSKDDLPEGAPLPKIGDEQKGSDGKIRKVAAVLTWQDRRARMQDVCSGCHATPNKPPKPR